MAEVSLFSDFSKRLAPKKRMLSFYIQESIVEMAESVSYRRAEDLLNKYLHRDCYDLFHSRTIADFIEGCGNTLGDASEEHAKKVLIENNFNPETGLPVDLDRLPEAVRKPNVMPDNEIREKIEEATKEYNARHEDFQIGIIPDRFLPEEDSSKAVLVSVDDVLVKHQKDERKAEFVKEKKNVTNTVIHIQADGKSYILTAVGIRKAFVHLSAFLLKNGLLENRQLVFLSDGAKEIKDYAEKFFSWRPYILILDWFHLAKRIKEFCSMCLKLPKDKKGPIIKKILSYLWVGDVDGAVVYVRSFSKSMIKNQDIVDEMCAYLDRKKENICCHAIRRTFNLRLSSNAAEKSNDLVVADRQKHNGMSWSNNGSGALAALSSAYRNNTLRLWIQERDVSMDLKQYGRKVKTSLVA